MMHEPEKSDSVVVAVKPTNKAEQSAAEPVEPRTETKGNADQQSTRRAQDRESVSQALERVRQAARRGKKERFTSLLHHVDPAMLRTAFYAMKRDAAPGVDGMTWETYEQDLDRRIEDLHARVQTGAYRAQPSRRSYIPKEDGSKRPLAVAALEDKIVQRAVAAVLSAIYEEDFLGFSYGFRPGRSQHDALDALIVGISSRKVNFILDADIRSFFTEVSQEWVVRFLEHRIGDKRILRLVQKWLRAGILEDGIVTIEEKGTGQGSVISPLLANVYLHYVFDLWAERWRRREATGDMIMVRYADDIVVGFQHETDARRFWRPVATACGIAKMQVPASISVIAAVSRSISDITCAHTLVRRRGASITAPDFPGERLVVCRNPDLAAQRTRKREDLLAATERDLAPIQTPWCAGGIHCAEPPRLRSRSAR